eukprot:5995288-Alexandrium_andersonii.AAC.1
MDPKGHAQDSDQDARCSIASMLLNKLMPDAKANRILSPLVVVARKNMRLCRNLESLGDRATLEKSGAEKVLYDGQHFLTMEAVLTQL